MPRYKKKHNRKCGVPEWSAVTFRSSAHKTVNLLATEAELNVVIMDVQDELFVRNILKSLGLKVK